MAAREERVSMPMTSAGIIGCAPDMKIAGKEIDPKSLVIAVVLIVVIVQIANFFVG